MGKNTRASVSGLNGLASILGKNLLPDTSSSVTDRPFLADDPS